MNIRKSISFIILLVCISCGKTISEVDPVEIKQIAAPQSTHPDFPRLLYTQDQINFVVDQINRRSSPWYPAYTKLISIADSYANREHTATADFHTPPFYDDKDENINAKNGLASDSHAAHANALAYALNGDEKYARKAIYFLNAWSTINRTITENDVNGEATGTVLTASGLMSGFLIAADLLSGQNIWPNEDQIKFRAYVQNILLPAVSSIKGKSNNWGDWGTYATAASYHILGKKAELKNETERMKVRIDKYQNEDGSMPQETRREGNGIWYTYFALTPMTLGAQLAFNTVGTDLFHYESPNGKKIEKALNYLEYYENHKSEWPWYQMKDSAPDKDAPSDLFEAMNDFYNNRYDAFVKSFRPVLGGYKGTRVSHTGWSFPTLMKMPNRKPSQYPDL
ncbi:MAG: alginate lyase family protein [Paludibacter sp.]|nr:alginate lyase family protein [Paludibacter sp.]